MDAAFAKYGSDGLEYVVGIEEVPRSAVSQYGWKKMGRKNIFHVNVFCVSSLKFKTGTKHLRKIRLFLTSCYIINKKNKNKNISSLFVMNSMS